MASPFTKESFCKPCEDMMKDYIHVVLSSDNNYAKYLAVTIVSILCNKAEEDALFFHVLDGGISQENRQTIEAMVAEHGASIEFLSIDQAIFSGKELNITQANHITLATYYRLLIPSILKGDRCIYMDCDMICCASLAPVWQTDLEGYIAAAVRDISEEELAPRLGLQRYFNAGFFLFDLKAMREKGIEELCFRFIEKHSDRILFHDQDVLNAVLDGQILELEKTWNCQVCKTRACKEKGFHALSRTANILHYLGRKKPWVPGCRAPGREQYWKYLELTPWKMSSSEKMNFLIKNTLRRILTIFK